MKTLPVLTVLKIVDLFEIADLYLNLGLTVWKSM